MSDLQTKLLGAGRVELRDNENENAWITTDILLNTEDTR